jgi:hypothetical protein
MKTKIAFLLAFLLYVAPNLFSQVPVFERTVDQFGNEVMVERDSLTGVAGRIWHSNPNLGMFPDLQRGETIRTLRGVDIHEQLLHQYAPRVLKSYKDILRVNPEEFRLIQAQGDGEFWYINFEQVYKGVPVFNGSFGFTLNQNGDIVSIGSDSYPDIDISSQPGLSPDEAIAFARKQLQPEAIDSLVAISKPELMIYPERTKQGVLHYLTFKVEIDDYANGEKWCYFVDAHSGAIVASQPLWREGNWSVSGTINGVVWPTNSDNSSQTLPPQTLNLIKVYNVAGQQVASDQIDANGFYTMSGNHATQTFYLRFDLAGSWARIKNPSNQVNREVSFVSSDNYVFNFPFTNTFDGFNAYYHMNRVHDFFKGSPFSYNGVDFQMEARVNDNSVPNARAFGTYIKFSSNNNHRWWENSDVVYHEYTHNTIYAVYGSKFIGDLNNSLEGHSMDEGISDYFAASLNQNSVMEWSNPTRNVANNLRMPLNQNEDAHYNGQILSGAMWDLQSLISLNTARKLNFKAMQINPKPDTFQEFVNNVILADENNGTLCDGTPNLNGILTAFQTNHGISPTNLPSLSVTISGPGSISAGTQGTWTANVCGGSGTISYQWSVRYEGSSTFQNLGTSQNQSLTFNEECTSNELKVVVTRGGQNAQDLHSVFVNDGSGTFCKRGGEESGADDLTQLPETFALHQNYPNPFNPTTEIKFDLPQPGQVTLSIFNIMGQKVRTLIEVPKAAGYHSVLWDGKDDFGNDVASGVYVYRIRVLPNGAESQLVESAKKMTLIR